jgi:hypothetical protein
MMDADTLEWRILRDAGEGGTFLISPKGSQVVMVTPLKSASWILKEPIIEAY